MIIQTGMRTDIPAFYSKWFLDRLQEGYVLVRDPYDPQSVTRYRLDPELVDLIAFCSKDPSPMLPHMDALKDFGQYWFLTITPYGRDVELNVPKRKNQRDGQCACVLGTDIGAYDSCAHLCRYCYANTDADRVRRNLRAHDPASPFLLGGHRPGDQIREARQESWRCDQLSLEL